MIPGKQTRIDTGKFTVSGQTDGASDVPLAHTIGAYTYRAREIIVWGAGDIVVNYSIHGTDFTDTIPVSAAGVKLGIGGAVSIDATSDPGIDYTLVF